MTLSPSITAAAVASPSVGLLIRLAIACGASVPVATVFINATSAFNASTGVLAVQPLAPTDAANTATGACALVGGTRRRLFMGAPEEARLSGASLGSPGSSSSNRRRLASGDGSYTRVSMGVNVYAPPSDAPASSSQVGVGMGRGELLGPLAYSAPCCRCWAS